MQNEPILDDFSAPSAPKPNPKTQRVCFYIELVLWAFVGIGVLLQQWASPYYPIALTSSIAFLALFYLLFPIGLFGSVGWRRHIGSHLVGFAMVGMVLPIHLALTAPQSIAIEQANNAMRLGVMVSIVTTIFYFARKDSPRGIAFFASILKRTVPLALLGGLLIEVVALRFS